MNITALGRYQIRGEIGRGNMGIVYRAHDPVIDRPVALKTVVLPESVGGPEREAFLKRFFQEARTAGRLIHPHIVVTYDAAVDEATGAPFIAMELIEGESLSQRLARERRIPWQQAVEWTAAIAQALHQAHREGIVHRDIKPANIMITRQGAPKITDFGIAKLPTGNLTQTGVVMGTPFFMSPEQLRGEPIDGRSDLFSLGALLYNLLTGARPFEGTELAAIASQVLYKNPRPLSERVPDLPAALEGVIRRSLMKAPGDRYADGEALARELIAIRAGSTPMPAAAPAEGTQPTKLPLLPTDSAPADVEAPLQPDAPGPAFADTLATVRRAEPAGVLAPPNPFWRSPARRIGAMGAAFALLLLSTAILFREELSRRKLYFDASRAAARGDLDLAEGKLEELLGRDPESEKARDFLIEVSSRLVVPELPFEVAAEHQHRLGSCTGRLTLREDALEYASKSHGRWQWPLERIRSLDAQGSSRLSLQTYDEDMLGLLDRKNYNFSLIGDSKGPEFWERYERLFQRAVEAAP